MQAVHHLLFGKTSLDSLSVFIKSLVLLATSLLLAVACQIQPIQRVGSFWRIRYSWNKKPAAP
jgi:hypothetical protein